MKRSDFRAYARVAGIALVTALAAPLGGCSWFLAWADDCHRVEHANGVKHEVCFQSRHAFYVRDLDSPDQALSEETKTASAAIVLDRLGRWPSGERGKEVVISSRASGAPPVPVGLVSPED